MDSGLSASKGVSKSRGSVTKPEGRGANLTFDISFSVFLICFCFSWCAARKSRGSTFAFSSEQKPSAPLPLQ